MNTLHNVGLHVHLDLLYFGKRHNAMKLCHLVNNLDKLTRLLSGRVNPDHFYHYS
jgi:hypothetical protein